jgi:hypothetical protein
VWASITSASVGIGWSGHGQWPLLTHVGAGEALKVGEAIDVARVAAGVAAVAVLPSVIPLAVTDIAGTVGCAYMLVAGESPDPPARFGEVRSGCVTSRIIAISSAHTPSAVESVLIQVNEFSRLGSRITRIRSTRRSPNPLGNRVAHCCVGFRRTVSLPLSDN